MICSQCQSENSFTAIFCDHCGARLETACPKCGEPNRQGAKFCRNCGQLINHTAVEARTTVPGVPSPEAYVPKHLAEKILAARPSLEGERKQVTVLFADIRSSTKLIEELDPEEAQKLIDPVLRVMMDAVHRYEGTVNQVLGDGIMALFGAPLAHEDHAVRACYAALAMQEEMRRYRANLGQSEEHGLQIGVGLNSGEVVVRSISNDLNVDYSALGHTTHLAARMQELSAPGAILITSATSREVEGFVEVKSLGGVQAKGVSRPIDAYELVGATSARKRLHASVTRGLTPFVGRKTEIDTFQKLVEKSASGRGQILSMVGEPGMGKSRLVYEFIQSDVPSDWLILEAPSVSYGKATPYFPVIELLRRYFSVSDADMKQSIRDKVINGILELDGTIKDTIPAILALLGALSEPEVGRPVSPRDSNEPQAGLIEALRRFNDMDPQQRRRYTFDAIKRLVIRESQKQPLMLVFEDLHWIDSETQTFLDSLVESLPMARVLLLVNYRPGYSHNWADRTYYTQVRVDPLQSASTEELLQHLLGNDKELAPLKESLIQRTEGNPFFAEESVRSLVETGILVGEKGNYRPGLALDSIRIPRSVESVVADRIDRLPSAEKHLLQTAAVVGFIFPFRLLGPVAELPEDKLYGCLAKLQAAEFIYETNLFPEVEYSFKHALTAEVAYGALLHERRTFLHARIVKALEEMTTNTAHDHLDKLANHAYHGELWDKAVTYSRNAGTKAMSNSAFLAALSSYERAFQALKHLPESREKLEQQIDFHLDSRNALFLLGDLPRIAEHLHAAESIAETLGDRHRLVRVLDFLNGHYGLAGEPERAIEFGRRALDLTAASENPASNAVTNYYLGVAYKQTGQYSQAIRVLEHGMQSVEGNLRHERLGTALVLSVSCRSHLVQCLAATGRFGEGVLHGEEGVRIAEEANHQASLVHVNCSLGVLFLSKGDLDKAISVLERSLKICHSANIQVYMSLVASRLGSAYANCGRVAEAVPYLEQGVETYASAGRLAFLSLSIVWLSEGYLLSGRLEEAREHAERAVDLSRKHKERGHEAWALKLLGDIALHRDPPDIEQAETRYGQAFALSDELGMRPLQAHCHVGLGNIYVAMGSTEQARAELSSAIDLFRSMDMTFWLPRAETTLRNISTRRLIE